MKHLIICADGTWNKSEIATGTDRRPVSTNVAKIGACIAHTAPCGAEQRLCYMEGVGSREGEAVSGGAFGWGLSRNILDAYSFLCRNYEPGDRMFFFGFSRGAFTVRSLAGMIRNCGIVRNEADIPTAFDLYREKGAGANADSVKARLFRTQRSHTSALIHFIGVWDTVGTVGIPLLRHRIAKWLGWDWSFHDDNFDRSYLRFCHAVAIDEKREKFWPHLVRRRTPTVDGGAVEEVWFKGVHSDVGGGYAEDGLSNITLQWMIEKAAESGLGIRSDWRKTARFLPRNDPNNLMSPDQHHQLDPRQYVPHDSHTLFYRVMEMMAGKSGDRHAESSLGARHPSVAMVERVQAEYLVMSAADYWTDWGPVEKGQRYSVEVIRQKGLNDGGVRAVDCRTGILSPGPLQQRVARCKRVPGQPYFQLIGAVNRDLAESFVITFNGFVITPKCAGTLGFFLNDVPGFYWNNRGRILLRITKIGPS